MSVIRMKILMVPLLLFTGILPLFARVGINMSVNRGVFMKHEHIYVCVTLRNDSGRPLLFGRDPELQGFLMFDVRDAVNRPIPKRPDAEISVTGLMLAPGEVRRLIFRLSDHFRLDRTGRFRAYAYVSHNLLKHEFRSGEVVFEISKGSEVWSRTVGIPAIDKANASREELKERTYSIRTLGERDSIGYYLIVEDERTIYGVARIGSVIGYEKFQAEIDMFSRLHLLIPVAPKVYHYLAYNHLGEILDSSFWKSGRSIPTLIRDNKNGQVRRAGGVPARPGEDYHLRKPEQITVSDILNDRPRQNNAPKRNSGVVDLGEGVMADAPGSRDSE